MNLPECTPSPHLHLSLSDLKEEKKKKHTTSLDFIDVVDKKMLKPDLWDLKQDCVEEVVFCQITDSQVSGGTTDF